MKTIRCIPLILMLFLCACVLRQAQWAPVGSQEVLSSDQIEADWPQGWMTLRPTDSDQAVVKEGLLLMVTRDGFELQTMRLSKRPLDGEFKHTQKKLVASMLPQEVADVVLDNIRANPEIVDLNVIENGPATLAGNQAFRVQFSYRSKSGLLRQSVQYGCIDRGMLVTLSFDAPKRHYFPQDLVTFETVKNSLRWKS